MNQHDDLWVFTGKERIAILVLLSLIVLLLLAHVGVSYFSQEDKSVVVHDTVVIDYRQAPPPAVASAPRPPVQRSTTNSSSLRRTPSNAIVATKSQPMHQAQSNAAPHTSQADTSSRKPYIRIEKYPKGTVVDLNTADSATFTHIPDIGAYTAGAIVRYRNRLGGYVDHEQLLEIYAMTPERIEPLRAWLTINAAQVQPLFINRLEFKALLRHPYLNYEQVKSIMNYRRAHGKLVSLEQLAFLEHFTPTDITRLTPYVHFD